MLSRPLVQIMAKDSACACRSQQECLRRTDSSNIPEGALTVLDRKAPGIEPAYCSRSFLLQLQAVAEILDGVRVPDDKVDGDALSWQGRS